jgi:hypothetical protein
MMIAPALLAGVPLALGTGTGSELRRPLDIAIVGGLIVSQCLTLFATPSATSSSTASAPHFPDGAASCSKPQASARAQPQPLNSDAQNSSHRTQRKYVRLCSPS